MPIMQHLIKIENVFISLFCPSVSRSGKHMPFSLILDLDSSQELVSVPPSPLSPSPPPLVLFFKIAADH